MPKTAFLSLLCVITIMVLKSLVIFGTMVVGQLNYWLKYFVRG